MNKAILITVALMMLLAVELASAELTINPNPASITVKQNEEKTFEAVFTNNFGFKILDFSFSNMSGFTFPAITLEPNESKTITYKVNYPTAGTQTLSTTVKFKYLVELPEDQLTHYVNITEAGFVPDRIVVRQGDTVIWNNNDVITRTVTSGSFDYEIPAGQQAQHQFNDIGEVDYQDLILFYGGTVVVLNASEDQKVNNPNYDITWNFNMEVALDPTSLTVNNNQENYSVSATGTSEGLLEIINSGDIIAQKVKLIADPSWIRFDENEFDLARGEKNFVTYHVEPKIFETDATNKTYTVVIRIEGTNTNQTTKLLNVFIPYSNVFDDIQTNEGFLQFYARFCQENPSLFICNPNANQSNGTTVIVRDPTIPFNLTAQEVIAMLKRIQRIEDSNARTNNELKQVANDFNTQVPQIKDMLNESLAMQKDNESSAISRQRAFWFAVFFLIIIGLILVIAFVIRRFSYKKNLMDGGYNFKY